MAVCLVSSLTDAELAKVKDGSRWGYSPLQSHPMPRWPVMPNPKYHDPAKPRKLAEMLAGLRKQTEDLPEHTANRIAAAVGQTTIPGWRMVFSDGCFCVSEPGPSTNTQYPREFVRGEHKPIGILPREAWRDYAPVRPLANEHSKAITWTFSADRVTFHTHGQPDLGEASSWHPGAFAEASVILADSYLWPCRGRSWQIDQVGEAILLTDLEQTTQIVIMGMRM